MITKPPVTRSTFRRAGIAVLGLALVPLIATSPGSPASASVHTPATRAQSYTLRIADWNIAGVLNDTRRNPPWSKRLPVVADQLLGKAPANQLDAEPDAITVQEANTSKRLARGETQYSGLVKRLNYAANDPVDYKAIGGTPTATHLIYNNNTLQLVDYGHVRWRAQVGRADGIRYLPWAILQVRSTGTKFFLASAHLSTRSGTVRNKQWAQLLRIVPGANGLSRGLPIIIGGDFNSTRWNTRDGRSAIRYLPKMDAAGIGDSLGQGTFSASRYLGGTPQPFEFSRARAQEVVKGDANTVNPNWRRSLAHERRNYYIGRGVDYLFVSNNITVNRWSLVANYRKSGSRYLLRSPMPSDHNQIRVTLTLPVS